VKTWLLTLLVSFLAGITIDIAWLMTLVVGTGESHPMMVFVLYASGVPLAAAVGFILGMWRSRQLPMVAVLLGWLFAVPFTPMTLSLSNPAVEHSTSDIATALLLIGFFYIFGVFGTYVGARWQARRAGTL